MIRARLGGPWLLLLLVWIAVPIGAHAAGISVDAGLTPAEDRWIVRAQARYMSRGDDQDGMRAVAFPLVLAYGARSDVSLFVQANPAFCCPSLVTEAMADRIREMTGVPVVTVTYDGTAAPANDAIVPYLKLASRRRPDQRAAR